MHYGGSVNFFSAGIAKGNNSLELSTELIWGSIFYAKKT
jgi:hypothetical protein